MVVAIAPRAQDREHALAILRGVAASVGKTPVELTRTDYDHLRGRIAGRALPSSRELCEPFGSWQRIREYALARRA